MLASVCEILSLTQQRVWLFAGKGASRDFLLNTLSATVGRMSDKNAIQSRIKSKVARGDFLANMLGLARNASSDVQEDFVENLTLISTTVRSVLENGDLIRKVEYEPKGFWPRQLGKSFCFVDGGVANIELPSAAPLGIRVGTYIVRPGAEGPDREEFSIALSLIDELYSEDAWLYDDIFDDIAKLRDAARITAEVAVGLQMSDSPHDLDGIFLHGPLVNPVSPYGLGDFPSFSLDAYRKFLGDGGLLPQGDELQFVPTYLEILNKIKDKNVPIMGVVERSLGRAHPVLDACLDSLEASGELTRSASTEITENAKEYKLNDSRLFDVVLAPGEYVKPVPVNRQGPENKWPDHWKRYIRAYPDPLTTYLKPRDECEPYRIEAIEGVPSLADNIAVLFHTSRLLPTYGFPVGLDIVDKYAKVPSWMSRSVRGQHAVVLMKEALRSSDPKVLSFAKRVLTAKGRDWLFRPEA